MVNVLRIFNDETGVELTQRTGKNPNYQYLQIGCSHKAIAAMLGFARQQVGKPFSSYGMMRSMIYPRTSDGSSWYCAELVAAALQRGGLMAGDSNPGEATPRSLFQLYKRQGAVMANPCTLRQQFGSMAMRPLALAPPPNACLIAARAVPSRPLSLTSVGGGGGGNAARRRADSPPRMQFKVLQARGSDDCAASMGGVALSLASLNMSRTA